MRSYAYYNGIFAPYGEIKIPLTDRAVFFGDGVYDAAVGMNGKIYRFHEHFLRFEKNAKLMRIRFSLSEDKLLEIINSLITKSCLRSYFIYFQVSTSGAVRMHERLKSYEPNLLVTVKPWSIPNEPESISLCTVPDNRHGLCNIKSLNLLASVMSLSSAVECGFDECAFINNGFVSECAHSNIFIVKSGEIITTPLSKSVLSGITRSSVIKLACERKIPVKIKKISYDELITADEAFITSTSRLCQGIRRINTRKISENNEIQRKIWQIIYEDYLRNLQN